MRSPVIVDSNVPIVANDINTHADLACVESCIQKLIEIQSSNRVILDISGFVLTEYQRHLSHRGQPGLGDAFFKWLWDNQAQTSLCTQIDISPTDDSGTTFDVFPDDPELVGFDLSDRKFVALALASPEFAPIVNATDTDWSIFRIPLSAHGIQIDFLCPQHTGG
ncbi:MAG: hypothetical protein IAE84_18065 [Saprospiraceae bacterium]|nr:hypothetical protein [Saprospiraceae bacterium]